MKRVEPSTRLFKFVHLFSYRIQADLEHDPSFKIFFKLVYQKKFIEFETNLSFNQA